MRYDLVVFFSVVSQIFMELRGCASVCSEPNDKVWLLFPLSVSLSETETNLADVPQDTGHNGRDEGR